MKVWATWTGQSFVPVKIDKELGELKLGVYSFEPSLPRSKPYHDRTFALIRAAFHHWPDDHVLKPEDPEHLRAHLMVEAGWRGFEDFAVPSTPDQREIAVTVQLITLCMSRHKYSFQRAASDNSKIRIYYPKSMAWSRMNRQEFGTLAQIIEEIIVTTVGASADDLLKSEEATDVGAKMAEGSRRFDAGELDSP